MISNTEVKKYLKQALDTMGNDKKTNKAIAGLCGQAISKAENPAEFNELRNSLASFHITK